MTWQPQSDSDGAIPDANAAIAQAVGAGSTCWEDMSGTGVFDDTKAREVVEGLAKFLHEHHGMRLPITRPEGHGWQPLPIDDNDVDEDF